MGDTIRTRSIILVAIAGFLILPGAARGAEGAFELRPVVQPLTQLVYAEPELLSIIEVTPTEYDFGDVAVGGSSTVIIHIQNINGHILNIWDVSLSAGSASAFAITDAAVFPVSLDWNGGSFTEVEVTFAPNATGCVTGTLVVTSDDLVNPTMEVPLSGTGVDGQPGPSEMISDIIDFFDASVADGSLFGLGPGNSADKRLNALRNMLLAAGDLIDDGDYEQACRQLASDWAKTDGLPRPPDFVGGEAAAELAALIEELMGAIGCE